MSACLKRHGLTWTLLTTVFTTCFGSSFLIGYNLGVLNLPGDYIREYLAETILNTTLQQAPNNTLVTPSFLYAQVSTTFVVAGALGAFSCGWLADILGRRNSLLFNHVFSISGGVISSLCVYTRLPSLLFIGRFLIGINCGISIGVASIFLTEIAPRSIRGAVGATHQLAVTIGIMVSYLLTLTHMLNTAYLWAVAVGLGAIPAVFALVILPCCPESPRFLFIKKNDEPAARLAFKRLNSCEDVETFIGELREEIEVTKSQPTFRFVLLFTQKDLRMAVLIACLLQVIQQLSGINAVITYSATMLKTAGLSEYYIQYGVVAIGALNVLVTIVSLPLLERAGRRTLIVLPTLALALALLLLTITVTLGSSYPDGSSQKQALGIVSICLILVYIVGFALGLGPVPALIVAELFRQAPRAAAYSLSQFIQWLSNLLVLFSYPSLNAAIGGYSFLPFLVIVSVCWVFFFLFMPETRNRTFDEVARDLAFGNIVIGRRAATLEDRTFTMFTKTPDAEVTKGQDAATRQRLLDKDGIVATC